MAAIREAISTDLTFCNVDAWRYQAGAIARRQRHNPFRDDVEFILGYILVTVRSSPYLGRPLRSISTLIKSTRRVAPNLVANGTFIPLEGTR